MTTIRLHPPLSATWTDAAHHALVRIGAAWQSYRARRHAEAAERELFELNLRTLEDIGAPHGLIGQRRWQDESRLAEVDRLLDARGW